MTVLEYQQSKLGTLSARDILATDISPSVLKQAREGMYDDLEIDRGLSLERHIRFLTRVGNKMRVRDEVKNRVGLAGLRHGALPAWRGLPPPRLIHPVKARTRPAGCLAPLSLFSHSPSQVFLPDASCRACGSDRAG